MHEYFSASVNYLILKCGMRYVGQCVCVCDNDDMLLCKKCFHRNTHMRVIYKYLPWKWAFFFVSTKWKKKLESMPVICAHLWRWIEIKIFNEYSRMSASMPIEKNIVMEMIDAKKNCENRYFYHSLATYIGF